MKKHGGKRAGAGRKPAPITSVKVTFSVRPDLVDALKELVKQFKQENK